MIEAMAGVQIVPKIAEPRYNKKNGTKAEIVEFMGVRYYRYPDSKSKQKSRYFQTNDSKKRLHVAIWEASNGPVPDGCVVHHIDHDPLNNTIDNLTLMTMSEHQHHHKGYTEYVPKRKYDRHYKGAIPKERARTCAFCGTPFVARSGCQIYCGRRCNYKVQNAARKREPSH